MANEKYYDKWERERDHRRKKSFIYNSNFSYIFTWGPLVFILHWASQIMQPVLLTICSLHKLTLVQAWQLSLKPIARTQFHNNVTFCEWPVVTHRSRQYISCLPACKVKMAIFIEQKPRESMGFGPSLCTAAPETLNTHSKSVFGNLPLCSFDTDKWQVLNLKGKEPAAIVAELLRRKPPGLLIWSTVQRPPGKGYRWAGRMTEITSPTQRNSRSHLISLDLNVGNHWTLTTKRTLLGRDATLSQWFGT